MTPVIIRRVEAAIGEDPLRVVGDRPLLVGTARDSVRLVHDGQVEQ
ncbi:hypothetical protein [Streptomyces sp. NPDC046759]